ncbi:MAG: DegT/DnrJ/EryC1/StrS family aminotransferase [Kofleriaceae bacterium]
MIPFFDMRREVAAVRADLDRAIARVLDSGGFVGGPEVAGFEAALAAHVGVGHAVGVSSGTDALVAIAMALGWGAGDEIVTTPLSFFATVEAIVRVGARPVFADVDAATGNIDPGALAAAVGPRTRAALVVHLFGRPATWPALAVPVVEDAAQAVGAAPVRGVAAALSFFPTKNLGGCGDGGAVLTDDAALADAIALVRNHGARPKYHHVVVGGNFRLDALQAAILAAKLAHLDGWVAARRVRAARYRAALADVAAVQVPPDDPRHVYHHFVIRAERRDALRAHLAAAGIGTEIYYPSPLHLQPALAHLGYRAGQCPVAEAACAELVALPMYPTLTLDEVDAVAAAVAGCFSR